jgi:hypothetical protein
VKPWEFTIRSAEDLPAFADLLEEWGHPGHHIVRHMIQKGKFPRKITCRAQDAWEFEVVAGLTLRRDLPHQLDDGALRRDYTNLFYSPTEAVWAVVNANEYLPWKQRYGREKVERLKWS